jgi:hypothetical protein
MKKITLILALLIGLVGYSQENCFNYKAKYNTIKVYEKNVLTHKVKIDVEMHFNYDCNNTLYITESDVTTYYDQDTKYIEGKTKSGDEYIAARFFDTRKRIKHLIQIFKVIDAVRIHVGDDFQYVYCNEDDDNLKM